jgi:hypothetical protein
MKKVVGISKNQFGLTVGFSNDNFITQFQRNFFTTVSGKENVRLTSFLANFQAN